MNPNASTRRNFTLFDLVVLGVATAAGFQLFRYLDIDLAMSTRPLGEMPLRRNLDQAVVSIIPFLIAWTFAFSFIRVRSPRPRWRRIARQPGMAGCIAVSVGIVYELSWFGLTAIGQGVQSALLWGFLPSASASLRLFGDVACLWVAAAWMVLALGGWWRAGAGWIDRLGRFLCFAWIAIRLLEAAIYHVP
jgi:hypothetical protein